MTAQQHAVAGDLALDAAVFDPDRLDPAGNGAGRRAANVEDARAAQHLDPGKAREPAKRRAGERVRPGLDHRDGARAVAQAGQRRRLRHQFRAEDHRASKRHRAMEGDRGLQGAGGQHAKRAIARQHPLRAAHLAGAGGDEDALGPDRPAPSGVLSARVPS